MDRLGGAIDDLFHVPAAARQAMRKAFPDHWSFSLGELALYSSNVLILTGTFLARVGAPLSKTVVQGSSL